ncbi:MAG: ABC transporter permease [Anaerolineales bacterium]|nr:ABC transporter permease [Anaerolineales bacterium]
MADEEKVHEEAQTEKKRDFGKTFLEEVRKSSLTVTFLAIVTGLLLGGLLAALTTEGVYTISPGDFVVVTAEHGPNDEIIAVELDRIHPSEDTLNGELNFSGEVKRTSETQIEVDGEFVPVQQWRIGNSSVIVTDETIKKISFGQRISSGLNAAWNTYVALFTGSIGDPSKMIAAIQSGDSQEIRRAFNPFFESLVQSTPYIFAGLAVALGFRVGLFNIGAEGQLFIGAITAVVAGIYLKGLPAIIHIPVSLLAGAAGGAIWGFIPGFLKAKTGGHEVINTIMMNYIAFRLSDYLLNNLLKDPEGFNPISPPIEASARLPRFFGDPIRFHLGFFIALGVAALVYWLLFKTKWGFDLRTVGANPHAAKYAGMNIVSSTIIAMSLSGALAGLAGTNEVLGVNYNLALAFSSGYGFDSIALALLGKSHPLGVVLASLLFGFLRNGAVQMQLRAGIPIDIISVIQAFILAFIAAPAIIRTIYRLKTPDQDVDAVRLSGWGGK